MHIAYFTERPYRGLDENLIIENRSFFGLSNSHLNRHRAAADYNYYIDEMCRAEQLGFDGVCLNEHHGSPYCMGNVMNIEASILARVTEQVKIILIGSPLPVSRHPLRMAEELATIDLISRGRLVTGWVRGSGSEQFFNNANPAFNREMFEEAHDFIVEAWTRPGPWRYEGKHFHYRHVNPWTLPYQQPIPQAVVPGVLSPETIRWSADRRYPYIGLGTALGATADLWDLYADRAAEMGYQAGSENFGYLIGTLVADTEEKAQELGKGFVFGGGQANYAKPEYTLPPGYNSKAATQRLAKSHGGAWLGVNRNKLMAGGKATTRTPAGSDDLGAIKEKFLAGYRKSQENYQLLIGTPDQVVEKAKRMIRVLRPGIFVFFAVQGNVSNEDRLRSMELTARHVLPEVREYGAQLGLVSPFERQPGSVALSSGGRRAEVVDRSAIPELAA